MIYYFSLANAYLLGDVVASMHRLRYQEFVERLDYKVPVLGQMEYDQYDTLAAIHFVWREENGKVCGSLRASPTSRPYMIKDIWPHVIETRTLPESEDVWEATRLCVDPNLPKELRVRIHVELLCALQEYALLEGIRGYIGIAPPPLWKYTFIRYGWPIEFLGEAQEIGYKERIRAGWMEASEAILKNIKSLNNIEEETILIRPEAVSSPIRNAQFETV